MTDWSAGPLRLCQVVDGVLVEVVDSGPSRAGGNDSDSGPLNLDDLDLRLNDLKDLVFTEYEPSSRKRLRKFPDLLEAVDEGVISLESAALIAGIKRPRVRVRADDVFLAVKTLLEYYTSEEILLALIEHDELLAEYLIASGVVGVCATHEGVGCVCHT